jgi:hypothetical protein
VISRICLGGLRDPKCNAECSKQDATSHWECSGGGMSQCQNHCQCSCCDIHADSGVPSCSCSRQDKGDLRRHCPAGG